MKKTMEFAQFEQAMQMILRADPRAVKEEMEREKQANAKKRKAKKKPSAFGHASSAKDD